VAPTETVHYVGSRLARPLARTDPRPRVLITKHPGPDGAYLSGIRSAQLGESDFLVSRMESEFPWI
jgi:hypothetical protein